MTCLILGGATDGTNLVEVTDVQSKNAPENTISWQDANKKVLARVGSSKLTVGDYLVLVESYGADIDEDVINPLEIITAWIDQEIVYQEAMKMKLDKNDTVKTALDQLEFQHELNRKQLINQAWMAAETKKIEIPTQETESYFNAHKDEFLYAVKVSQIMTADESLAGEVYLELKQGADFTDLAGKYSIDGLEGQPSDFISRGSGQLTLAMEDAIFVLEPGQFSEPVATLEGYTFIFYIHEKVQIHKTASYPDYALYLEQMIRYQKAQTFLTEKIDSLKAKAHSLIEINLEHLVYPEGL
ncbi:peptidyl-prolyl cis-trans isomerase [candidate division WOR-3 bacterium]|nr:peptidyl-prolyl cis-trans isomerase [candidate division WOR-3 bacterium]